MTATIQELAQSTDLLGSRAEMAQLFATTVQQHGSELTGAKAAHAATAAKLESMTVKLAAEVAAHAATQTALNTATAKLANLEKALAAAGVAITTAEKA
jgi:hypothetical protein